MSTMSRLFFRNFKQSIYSMMLKLSVAVDFDFLSFYHGNRIIICMFGQKLTTLTEFINFFQFS